MSAPTPARSKMVAAMIAAMCRPTPYFYTDADQDERARMYIAAVLDNLPREVMARATGFCRADIDRMIAAARVEVLGHE